MMDIGVSVSGPLNMPNAQEVAGAIRRAMQIIALTVANQATQNADGRPGPNVQTGRLRSSITGRVSGDGFSAVIGSNVEYAPRIEMGYHGPEGVKAHTRTIRQAFGHPIAPRDVRVSAFTRTANAPAYPFLRPAVEYAQRIHAIEDILQREIYKAVNS
jgi:phage gpG-like protein